MLIALSVLLILFLALFFLVFPSKAQNEKIKPFVNRYYAHRGLHNMEINVPENSLEAFRLAAKKGYAVEFDVHITKDDKIIVFHDDDLNRMCGVNKKTDEQTYSYLQTLSLAGTNEKIPLFSEVLNTYNAAGPILLELKTGKRNDELCRLTYEILKSYKGDVCIESFDPRIVAWWKRNAPEYLRGQLAQPAKDYKGFSPLLSFALSRGLTNFLARPNFIAYKLAKKPLCIKLQEKLGALRFSWTSRSINDKVNQDAIIFEHYEPELYL